MRGEKGREEGRGSMSVQMEVIILQPGKNEREKLELHILFYF